MSDSNPRSTMTNGVANKNVSGSISSTKMKQPVKRKIGSEKNNSNEDLKWSSKKLKRDAAEKEEIDDDCKLNVARRNIVRHCSVDQLDQGSSLGSETIMQEVLSDVLHVPLRIALNLVNLFESDCTIPFIARYRKELTNSMDPDKLRLAKETYENVKTLKVKASSVVNKLKKVGKLTNTLNESILNVKSLDELDHIYAPFKEGNKRTKAELARSLGLEAPAMTVFLGKMAEINLADFVDPKKDGLKNFAEVTQSVRNIIADVIAKDVDVLDYLRTIQKDVEVIITSAAKMKKNEPNADPQGKFQTYHNFKSTTRNIQPHQILALNRGESLKALTVKYTVSEYLSKRLKEFCYNKWMRSGIHFHARDKIFEEAFDDSYSRLIIPFFLRRIRSELNMKAESTAIENFALNLRNLLLTSPVRGCPILGIDPGFRNGCKVALVAVNGGVLWTTTIYQDRKSNKTSWSDSLSILKRNMVEHNCELIALGNGTGCREIESDLSKHISEGFFLPELDVQYTIVNERGASIYSCTALAKEEFPSIDQNIVSAIYIARCLQDPMSELVKIEPKHLGVGMYQHDVPEKKLDSSLEEIVSECVSFAGVDINVASSHLLKRVAGLSAAKASSIIEWREKHGCFVNREEIKLVKGIGPKTYEQCAGFVKIIPETANVSSKNCSSKSKDFKINLLDKTVIHPESYEVAHEILKEFGVKVENIGSASFIEKIQKAVDRNFDKEEFAKRFGSSAETISLIIEEFQKKVDDDYRSNFAKPVFKRALASIHSLSVNDVVNGYVTNVTSFGAFVDIGVGVDGLVHVSKMRSVNVQVGQRLKVCIISVDVNRNRIGLNYLSHIQN